MAPTEEQAAPHDQLGGKFIESWRELATATCMTTGLADLLQLDAVHPKHPMHHLAFDLAGDLVHDLRFERQLGLGIARQTRFGQPLIQPNLNSSHR
ncbi:hypothetical protein ABIA06_003321 [Bradyrhizobium yuanmingense]|uniref:hypothetical protein n=1 Tax=Bradyrhizobium TaxID=374 RepID=UPI0011B1F97F|nr:hypothetical protein [Bradyrhizobium sp. SUTN9-2]